MKRIREAHFEVIEGEVLETQCIAYYFRLFKWEFTVRVFVK